ncbi:hypothetical protein FOL47_010926 [Perkinsus chesapeaki]|uniref:RRM domain-containing protein n=1 Tax=Perkinsus chesapeaki TaxID=330153 RepID=A0A7J6N1H7_PERCH|nr:hypothetical protein FOL47_010926 [Perkinsus chesapeaki]
MEKSNLIVNYLPSHIQEGDLAEMFEPFGAYQSVKIVRDKNTGMSMGFGFVNFEENASAEAAVKELNGLELPQHPGSWRGPGSKPMKKIKVSIARPAWKANIHSNLYVANIPPEYDAEQIRALFGPVYGPQIEHLRMLRDNSGGKVPPELNDEEDTGSNNRGKFRGIAVIRQADFSRQGVSESSRRRFDTEENATAAMEKFNGTCVPDMPESHPALQIKPWRPEFRADRVPQGKAVGYSKQNSRGSSSSDQTNRSGEAHGRSRRSTASRSSGTSAALAAALGAGAAATQEAANKSGKASSNNRKWVKGVPKLPIDSGAMEESPWAAALDPSDRSCRPSARSRFSGRSSSKRATASHDEGLQRATIDGISILRPSQLPIAPASDEAAAPGRGAVNESTASPSTSHCSLPCRDCQYHHSYCGAAQAPPVVNSVVLPGHYPNGAAGTSAYCTPIKQASRAAFETPGRDAPSVIAPITISPQLEHGMKTLFYDQPGIVSSSVQIGPDRSWGCASFSSLGDAEHAVRSLYGAQVADGMKLCVELFPYSSQFDNTASVHQFKRASSSPVPTPC